MRCIHSLVPIWLIAVHDNKLETIKFACMAMLIGEEKKAGEAKIDSDGWLRNQYLVLYINIVIYLLSTVKRKTVQNSSKKSLDFPLCCTQFLAISFQRLVSRVRSHVITLVRKPCYLATAGSFFLSFMR